jgi:hypothetical protein
MKFGAIALGVFTLSIGAMIVGNNNVSPQEKVEGELATFLRNDGVGVKGVYCDGALLCRVTLTDNHITLVPVTMYEDGSWSMDREDRP